MATNGDGANTAHALAGVLGSTDAGRLVLEVDEDWLPWTIRETCPRTVVLTNLLAGELNYNVNAGGYAAGPTNPFGTPTLSNKHYSLYATYTTGALAVAHMTASRG